jgi:hypothetical protein
VLDGRLFAPVMLIGAVLATVAMEHALVTHDFSIVFVAENNSKVTPLLYSITGLWSALAGSILLWGLVLTVFAAIFVWRYRGSRGPGHPLGHPRALRRHGVLLRDDGRPGQPVRHHPDVTAGARAQLAAAGQPAGGHPPAAPLHRLRRLHGALRLRHRHAGHRPDRRSLADRVPPLDPGLFTFLSVGIVLGAWWSYQVLGWGGFWGWDPVENAALLPWLCGTAYLHSVLVQERRGLMRVWNLSLSVATFALTILGTFLTRSGVINSVHAFSESTLGPILIGFFFVVVVVGFGLIAWRGDRLRSPGGIDAPLGREGAFLLNNLLFVGFAFVVLLGTLYPLLYEAVTQQQVNVGAPFFNTVAVPVGLALLFLMAVAPALSWRKISGRCCGSAWPSRCGIGVLTVVLCVAFGLRGFGRWSGSASAPSPPPPRRAPWCSRSAPPASATSGGGAGWSGGPTAGWSCTSGHRHGRRDHRRHHLPPPDRAGPAQGQVVTYDGHRFEFVGLRNVTTPSKHVRRGAGQGGRAPSSPRPPPASAARSPRSGRRPSTRGLFGDVYLTFDQVGGLGHHVGELAHPEPARPDRWPSASSSSRWWPGCGPAACWSGGGASRAGARVAPPGHRPRLGPLGHGGGPARRPNRAGAGDGRRPGARPSPVG